MSLTISILPVRFAVCQLEPTAEIPAWAQNPGFHSITRTVMELSILCAENFVPVGIKCECGWVLLRLEGPFSFNLTGILLAVLDPLAKAGISIFALSTFDTDYVMVKHNQLDLAIESLRLAGHMVVAA